jgi:glutaredoxin
MDMKKLIVTIALLATGYKGWQQFSISANESEPLYAEPYVVVYGRNSCGFTQQTLKDLKRKGIPFKYESVDDKAVADVLHSRMESSGIDTRRYNLPVVDVSNSISVRPETKAIIETYQESRL